VEAKGELEEALLLMEPSAIPPMARLHRKTAKVLETQREFQQALEHYSQAETLLQQNLENQPTEWQREWLQIYLDRSWSNYTRNLQEAMQKDISIMAPLVHRIGTPTQKMSFYQNSVLLAYRRERYRISEEILSQVDLSLKAAQETEIASNIAHLNFVSGFARLWYGDLDASEKFLLDALSEASRLEDAVLKSRCLTYLTVLYRKRIDLQQTALYADRSLEHSTAINMQEYVAAAWANQAWLRWRSQDYDEAKRLGLQAVEVWQSLPLVSPFQDLAVWPVIGVLLRENQISEACRYADILLNPSQHRLESPLEQILRTAVQASAGGDLDQAKEQLLRATNIVEGQGYL
jgi:tetratricopeptide (TPR) repeat protein